MSVSDAVRHIEDRLDGFVPRIGLVLGSGLGGLAEQIDGAIAIDYGDLLDFPQPTVSGHVGRYVFGMLAGQPVACMQGRLHFYEGHSVGALAIPIRVLKAIGCEVLILTNAAGSLREEVGPSSLMLINDHINFVGVNPLIGPNDDRFGERFFDVSQAYDPELRDLFVDTAGGMGVALSEGVYAWYSGPNFETPAEIRALRILGADAVGMSTVPECLVARHAGMRVPAVSIITNLAAGMMTSQLSHQQTLENAGAAADKLASLLHAFMLRL